MTTEILLVLGILAASIVLFAWEKFGPDIVAMLVLITLALTGLVDSNDVFSGFASPAVVTVWAIYIVSEGLFKTGVADYLGANILKIAGNSEIRLISLIMLTVGVMSAFMNNIGATAVLMPAIIGICKQTKQAPSKFLIPLAYASLMGGNMTLIGTPPNILASAELQKYTGESFGFFDFMPMGIIILGSGILYTVLIGRHLLPRTKVEEDLTRSYHLRDYATELRVLPNSPLVGKTILESKFGEEYDLTIINKLSKPQVKQLPTHLSSQRRLSSIKLPVQRQQNIAANDIFWVKGKMENILKIKDMQGLEIGEDVKLQDEDLKTGHNSVAEIVIAPASELVGKTLKAAKFREQFNLTVLALWRDGHPVRRQLADEHLQFGDVLLVQGPQEKINLKRADPNLVVIEAEATQEVKQVTKAPIALTIMAGMLIVVTMGWLHISVAAVIAAILMVMVGILSMDEAYRAIQWRSIFLIAGMLPIGIAMENTGTARFLADQIVHLTGGWGPMGVLLGIYVMTLLLTQPMSNAAATVLVAPIAIDAAVALNVDPKTFVMAVVVAASTAFLTPIGHQVNVLVYGVGGYKFFDFTKIGFGLTIMYLILVAFILPIFWPF